MYTPLNVEVVVEAITRYESLILYPDAESM
jgi:hypothetical protein